MAKKVFMYGGINHACQFPGCRAEADWRGRNRKTGDVIAAACNKHKEQVRAETLARLLAEKKS